MPLLIAPPPRRQRSTHARASLAVIALIGTATGPGCTAPAAPRIQNGSRLHARWEVIGADARRFVGWFDTVLGVPCTFAEDFGPNRSHRCVPTALITGAWFADAACSQPLAQAPMCGAPAAFAVRASENACSLPSRYFRRGPLFPTPAYYRRFTGECIPGSAAPAFRPDLYALGEELPEATFVAATETPASSGGRIRQLWLAGDDGSRTPWGGWDSERRVAVHPLTAADGQLRWLPTHVAYSELHYADAACTEAIATKIARDARCPLDAVIEFVPTGQLCMTYRLAVHEIGRALQGPTEYARDGSGVCVALPQRPPPDSLLFATGAVVPPESFALAHDDDMGVGDGRVRRAAGPDGEAVIAGGGEAFSSTGSDVFVDARYGEVCRATRIESQFRCVPAPDGAPSFAFQDAACNTPIALFDTASACHRPIPRLVQRGVQSPSGPCSDANSQWWTVGEVAASDASTQWYAVTGSRCVPIAAPGPNVEPHWLDRPLGAADFLEIQETVD